MAGTTHCASALAWVGTAIVAAASAPAAAIVVRGFIIRILLQVVARGQWITRVVVPVGRWQASGNRKVIMRQREPAGRCGQFVTNCLACAAAGRVGADHPIAGGSPNRWQLCAASISKSPASAD